MKSAYISFQKPSSFRRRFASILFSLVILAAAAHAQVVSNGITLSTDVAGFRLFPINGTGTVLVNSNSTLRNASSNTPTLLISRTNHTTNDTWFITNNGLMTNSGTTDRSQVFDVQIGNYTFVNNASGVMAINPSSTFAVFRSSQFTNAKSGVITNYGLMQGLNSPSIVNLAHGAFTFHNEGTVRGSISHYGGDNGSLTVNQVAGEITANAATNFVYALYSAATTSAVNVSGGKITKDLIFEGSNSVNAVNLSGGQINGNIVFNNSSSTNSVLVTGGGLNGNISFSNSTGAVNFDRGDAYSYTNIISGSGRLTNSSGTTTLTANNTYSGSTTINGGTLIVASGGSISSNSIATVGSGAHLKVNGSAGAVTVNGMLSGSGTVGAVTLNSGGTLAVGNSPGQMNAESATWNAGSTFQFEIINATGTAGVDWDFLSVAGILDLTSISSANKMNLTVLSTGLANYAASTDYTWVFAKAASLTGAESWISGLNVTDRFTIESTGFNGGTQPNGGFQVVTGTDGGYATLSLRAVPEPGSASLVALGLATLLLRKRRCRR